MANEEVQQMTVGVTLEMENFQRQLLKITLELEKLRRIDLGLDVNAINNINKVLKNLAGTINSVGKGSNTNIVDSGKLEKTASEAKKVSAELQTAAKAVKEYHASFENLLNTKYQSQMNANMKQVENAFSRAKKAMADAKLDSKELGLMPTMFSTFDIKQNSAALKEQLASVAKVNSKLQAQITDDTKATTTAKTTAEKQVQQSAKVQAEAIHQTVTDEKLRQSVVNQTKLLLTELRKIVAALGDTSKKSTGEATQGYEQQGKVIAELTAKIGELAKAAVQAEQTKQTAVNQTTKAYESQQKMYEQLQKNMATAPNEAAYNANQQAYRKAYNYQATKDINTPVSEYMTTPYRQAIYNQIQSALQGKEFQKLLGLAPTDKRARFDERAERWAKAVDSLTDVMPATVAALKSATWNPYADKEGYFGAAAASYARKPRKEVAAEEASIRATLANMERDRIDSAAYQKQWDKYVKANETAKYNEAWKKVEQEKVDNAKLVAKATKDEVRQYERDLAELEKLRKERIKQEAKALAEQEKANAQAQKAYRKAYEDAYYSTGVGAGVRANREGQGAYSKREVEKMLADMPAHVQNRVQAQRANEAAALADNKALEQAARQKQVTLDRLEEAQRKHYEKIQSLQNEFQKYSEQGIVKTSTQWRDLERRYESHAKAMAKIAVMANKLDPTWRYADNPDINTAAGRIESMAMNARAWQQFTPENRLKSNREARQSMLDNWNYFGNDQGFSAQISQLRQLKEAAWLDYKQGGAIGDPAMMEKSLKQLSQAKTIEQQLVKYMEEYNRVLGTTETTWGKFTRKLHSHLNWITAGATLGLLFTVPTEAINSIVKTDEAMHNLGTVMQGLEEKKWDESLGKWVHTGKQDIAAVTEEFQKLNEAAMRYGATNADMIESARLWGRMYKDPGTVNTLTSQSAKLAVADNFSIAESTKAVEAAMFQFGLVARSAGESLAFSNEIVDVYTKLSHNAGASAQDLARGVERSGAAAHLAGMDFEFLTSLIAAGTRATALSGQEIGNMMKTLVGSYRDKKSIAEFEKLGITIKEVGDDGVEHFKPLQEVLMDVSVTAATTDKDLQKLYKAISGGKFQWNKAANTLKDYKEIIKNWGQAVDSQGFTDKQVEVQMDSITRRMAKFKADLEGIWITGTNGGLTESLKETISALDGLLKLLNGIPHEIYAAAASFAKFLLAAKLAATVARIYSEQMLALRTSTAASTAATIKDSAVKNVNTAANERNAVSAASAATATRQLAGGMTMAAGAGKLLATTVKGLLTRIPQAAAVMLVFEAIGKVVESLSDYDEAADKARQTTLDEYAAHEQSIMMGEKRVKFVDALLKAHGQLSAAIAETNDNDEKRKKIQEDIEVTEQELTNVLGKEAVERMKQDGWTEESKKRVRDTYVRTIEEQKKSAKAMMLAEYNKAVETAKYAKAMIELYDREADAFIHGNNEKIKSLNWLKRAEVAYADWRLGNAKGDLEAAEREEREAIQAYKDAVAKNAPQANIDLLFLEMGKATGQRAMAQKRLNKEIEKDEKTRNDAFYDTFHPNNDENKKDLEAAMQIMRGIDDPSKLIPDPDPTQNKVDGDGDGENKFGKVFDPTNPSYKLQNAADTLVSKQILGELQKQTALSDAQLSQLQQQKEMFGVTDDYLKQSSAVWKERAKFRNDAVEKLTKERDRLIGETGGMVTVEDVTSGKISNFGSSAGGGGYSSGHGDIDAIVNQMAAKYGVDSALIHAVIGRESSYNKDAVSDAGAIGLMQLMPRTAESLGVDPYDWAQNIEGGVKYLSQLLTTFGGDVRKAVAAYNAGPGAVKDYGGVPPYKETQKYVENVLADYENNKANSGVAVVTPDKPLNIWDYIEVDDPAKIEGLTDEMKKKIAYFAKLFMDATNERLIITSGKRNASDGVGKYSGTSLHNTGNAVDIGNNAIFGDRSFLKNLAKAAGLNSLFEVTAEEQAKTGATGPHVHLSNTGAEMPGHASDIFSSGVSDEAYRKASVNYTAPDMEEIYQKYVPKNQWASMSTKERADFFNAHKQEFADAEEQVAKLKQIENIQTKINSIIKAAYEEDKKAYKQFVADVKQQADETIRKAEYAQQEELTKLGLAATAADQSKLQWDVERTKVDAYTHALGYLSDTTKEYAAMLNNVRKAQLSADQAAEKYINDRYTTEKEAYERLAKARDLAMGDMSDGMNWFNRYGETHFNALKDAEAEVERLHKKLDSLRNDTVTKDKKAIEETQNALTEAMQKAEKVRKEFQKKINDGLYDIAEKLIFEGENIEDIFKNLWKDLGKDALKILMHQDVGEGSFLTQLLGIAKSKDGGNRLKSVQTETGQLSTDLANNASSVEQTQGIINNEQNIAMGTWQRLDQIVANTANNGQFGVTEVGAATGSATGQPNKFTFNQEDYALSKNIEKMGWHSEQLNLQTMKQTQAVQESTKATTDNTRGIGQAGTIMTSLAGIVGGLFGNSKGGRVASAILGGVGAWFGLRGLKTGGWFDGVPKFAKGGNADGKISGAGTGRSDSILAYLANKGKFVMLSNGEYVINEKSAKALGYETLDQLNHYADGGVLNPTPYVPTLNQKVVDSTLRNYGSGNNGLYRQSGTSIALMEKQNKMMAEQNDMLKNADKQQGGGQIIVLNTHASSDDVMRALQENPRALQAILGRQNRMGFR